MFGVLFAAVWAIMGFPIIAIIVGDRAMLVVDTGLGPRNGATVARVAARLAKGRMLYLITTHFHPEHAAGEPAFPSGTILIRNTVQQRTWVGMALKYSIAAARCPAQNGELLEGSLRFAFRTFSLTTRRSSI